MRRTLPPIVPWSPRPRPNARREPQQRSRISSAGETEAAAELSQKWFSHTPPNRLLPALCHAIITKVSLLASMADCAGLSSDVIQHRGASPSKIYVSIVYLWTEGGPEINNGPSAAMPLGAWWRCRGRARPRQMASARGSVIAVTGGSVRRRSRQAVSRPRVVQFSLTEEEFEEVSAAAEQSGMARGAFAAEAALASARGDEPRVCSSLREALAELITAAGLVRRAGTNLNQAVAKLNATGQRGEDLLPAAQFCARVIRRLDETAEQLRRAVP